jgi:thiol-disulfide isomerase/thioredoxin
VIVTVTVAFLAFYTYPMLKRQAATSDMEPAADDTGKIARVMFFYTTWCPYCKTSRSEWDKFALEWNGNQKSGYKVVTSEIDCDMHEGTADQYSVQGYPSIKMVLGDRVIDYDAKPDVATLNQFLDEYLN